MSNLQTNPSCAIARIATLVFLVAAAGQASAQTSADAQFLPPIVVTASRTAQAQSDALPHITVISAEDIRNSQAVDLPSLLRREAGIQFFQTGGPGQTASLFMRGAQPGETLILIDGVPVRRPGFSPAPALEHILPDQIDHIEIVRGNVSAIYGSGAMGGVIQIFTKQGAGAPAARLAAEAGSRGTRKLSAELSGKSNGTRYAMALTGFRTDGFSANDIGQYPNENPDDNGDRNSSFAGNLSHEWAKGHEFGLRTYANDGKFSFDGGGFGAPADSNNGRSRQRSLALFSKDRLAGNWSSTLTLSQTATRNENISISAFGYVIRDNGDTSLLQWANELSLSQDWNLVAGLDAGREKLDAFSDYGFGATRNDYTRSTSSLYLGLNGKTGVHDMQANIRYDRVGGSGSDLTGYLGYGYALAPSVKLIANVSSAFKAPELAQLNDPLSGNPALESERSRSFELGAQYAAGASIVRATWFNTRTTNQFAVDPNNCFSGDYPFSCPTFNIARGSNKGLELSATGRVNGIDARASVTSQNPRNDTTGAVLIRRARTLASLSLSKPFGAWRVGSDFQYAGSRPDTDFVTGSKKELGAYWLANLNLDYQVNKNVAFYGRIDNVFDRDYQTAYGYNQPPRGLFAGVRWQPSL